MTNPKDKIGKASNMSSGVASEPDMAVALQYEHGKDHAPRVTAKGEGEMARRIVALAREHDIMVEGNPALTKALSEVELDDYVPEHLFTAVAVVIGFVMETAEKKRNSPFASASRHRGSRD
nr:EscU/YscU/HrcU family type III secretion system export apparatus switch protein [uncultured Cohaesibacter sp.]